MKHIQFFVFVLSFFVSAVAAQDEIMLSVSTRTNFDDDHFAWHMIAKMRPQTDIADGQLDIQLPVGFKVRTLQPEKVDLKANQYSFFISSWNPISRFLPVQ